ncbi:GDP-L-fucose synthase [Candidatus Pelagibacter bacterium]|nr:GDP-L-fucose synthase [Candidatus Pelagibacter bacterium]MDB2709294.1 GDP-L-fucose synthase [Candidatus Pelagibacter bacterium]
MKKIIKTKKKVWITGPNGMVGSSLVNKFKSRYQILSVNKNKLNLLNQTKVFNWIKINKPDIIIMSAAKVGGIYANDKFPAQFIYENLQIQSNIIEGARQNKIKKLIFIGSSCIYPRDCKQPIREEYLLSGKLEKTNQWYAIAKIAGIKMIQAYRKQYKCNFVSVMPCNMYGPNDNYDLKNSHVMAALIRKFSEAKKSNKSEVIIWGTGKPLREFMHVDDLSNALFLVAEKYNLDEPINIGTGHEISIINLAKLISKMIGFKGKIIFDKKYPDGTPRKVLNNKKIIKIGWKPNISLEKGIKKTLEEYIYKNQ